MRTAVVVEILTGPVTDEKLLQQSVDGDRRAFGTLHDRHSRIVYAVAITATRNPADAEEVSSDTFFTLWKKRATVRFTDGSALPWLIATARYQAMNHQRARFREATISLNDDVDTHTSASAETIAAERQLAQRLEEIIADLGPLEQSIVHLCLVDRLTYEQAALKLDISHATVRNRLARSRTQLRHELHLEEGTS